MGTTKISVGGALLEASLGGIVAAWHDKVEGSRLPQNLIKDARWKHPTTSGGLSYRSFDAITLGGRWME